MPRRKNPFIWPPSKHGGTLRGLITDSLRSFLERFLGFTELARIYDLLPDGLAKEEFVQATLDVMNSRYEISSGSIDNIPASGPVVIVANHPFGGIEGVILADIMSKRRADSKILATDVLKPITEIQEYFLFVDVSGTKSASRRNIESMRSTLDWLGKGAALGVFPSGTVSHLHIGRREISDPDWSLTLARIIRKSGATVVPVFFEGRNGILFQIAGVIHPLLRTLLLPRELANKQNYVFRVKIGQAVTPEKLANFESDEKLLGNLRLRTYLLADYQSEELSWRQRIRNIFSSKKRHKPMEAVVRAEDKILLFNEVERLTDRHLLIDSEEFSVYCAQAKEIPHVLREIGRLRELTFREVSEGTGFSIDLDSYDNYYHHLFVWNNIKHEVVGAYRLGKTDVIVRRFGKKGLYTSSLFDYKDSLLDQLSPALELGRSFVRKEYQRTYQPLLLLWKGIGSFVVKNPKYNKLFGTVSINSEYESISRRLIMNFLTTNNFMPEFAKLIRARNPMKNRPIKGLDAELASSVVSSLEDVHDLLGEIEKTQKQVPVLLRQYLKMGGKLLGFNVDPNFGNVLDGLLVVDMLETDPKLRERYLGKQGSASFVEYHAQKGSIRTTGSKPQEAE